MTTTKTILAYGAISGAVIIGTMTLGIALAGNDGSKASASQLVGYLIMLIALSSIFVGVKRYRDQELGGVIRFGKAFLLGLGITVVAGAVYVAGWEIYLAATDHAFIDQYSAAYIESEKAAGLEGAELEALVADMEEMKRKYAIPAYRLPITFLEIFPVGLIVSLISALVLRKSTVLPAGGAAASSTA